MSTVNGYQLLDVEPDFSSAPQVRVSRLFDQVNIGPGPEVYSFRGKRVQHVIHHSYTLQSRVEFDALYQFWNARKGRWQGFAVPSWHGELNPAANLLTGNAALSIDAVDYANVYGPDTSDLPALGNWVFLLHQDGTLWTPQVLSVAGTSPEILTLGENAAKDWNVGEYILGFVYFVRFLNDELEFTYQGENVSTCELAMSEFLDVVAEDDVKGDPPIEGIAFYDEFDTLTTGQTENMNRGYGWLAAWTTPPGGYAAYDEVFDDDLSGYSSGTNVNGTTQLGNGGTGTFVAN